MCDCGLVSEKIVRLLFFLEFYFLLLNIFAGRKGVDRWLAMADEAPSWKQLVCGDGFFLCVLTFWLVLFFRCTIILIQIEKVFCFSFLSILYLILAHCLRGGFARLALLMLIVFGH